MAKQIGADKTRTTKTLGAALGAELTRLRIEKKWSQSRLADMLGYDQSYIRQLEQGAKSPTLRTLSNIAAAFAMPLSALIKRAERRMSTSMIPRR